MSVVRFAALGDSITLGMGDPLPSGGWRGWAALLGESLAPPGLVDFHNLAESGAQAVDLVVRQVPRALALRPHVASVVVGVNDTLRGTFDAARVSTALAEAVGVLRATGAIVLTARLPDPGRMFGLPGVLARPLARRIRAVNAGADLVATRFGTLHFDAANHPSTYDRPMWSVDRLHPSERGHRLLATSYHDLLTAAGFPVWRRPDSEPTNPPPTRLAQLRWLATKGTKWVYDRSADLVPYLVRMAATEWWCELRGEPHPEEI